MGGASAEGGKEEKERKGCGLERRAKRNRTCELVMAASLARTRRLASSQAFFEGSQSSRLAFSDSQPEKYDFYGNFQRKF